VPGFPELFVILVILVIVFGAKAFPNAGTAVGRMVVRRRRTHSKISEGAHEASEAGSVSPPSTAPSSPRSSARGESSAK
jgi:Sec-independent protein translocase protein TatA